ncbi:head GIN domain-containing protein [Hymenobacter sp. M29]|uniref:Head GIN domain-containing protein n=1 Tax=Hymenobacter mellowenesis TaxID=3063995 RepID=A0ABT9AHA7_9BACT|nr:head GIN domain-containing protein [Hymenobacter sp. M29]MDO7848747.1 head GIN domain-containing protein [Hymenobacter sp. M29]
MKNLLALALLWLLALVPALAQTAPEVRVVGAFRALKVSDGVQVTLVSGSTPRVEASADNEEFLNRLKTDVRDGVLRVSFEHKMNESWSKDNRPKNLRVSIVAAPLTGIEASSGSRVDVKNAYDAGDFTLEASSGAVVSAPSFTGRSVKASVSSGAVASLGGKVQSLNVQASSGGVFKGQDVQAATCDASASSGGTVAVAVQDKLVANASSGGDVRYSGSPQVTKHTSSGGSVKGR